LDETVACCLDSPRGARPMAPSFEKGAAIAVEVADIRN